MTAPSAETLEREKDKFFVTDAELIRRLGVPDDVARPALRALDDNPHSGFPKKQKLWGDRRWWPAVEAYFNAANHVQYGNGGARVAPERRTPHSAAPPVPMRPPQRRGQNA